VKQAKLLGVHIDATLSWDAHVEYVSKKIIRKFAVLKRGSYFLSSNFLLKVYNSIVSPILLTAVLFGPMSKTDFI
jgi:hypothetical protein